jgi:hypothetical protein
MNITTEMISDVQVQHKSEEQGPRIGRVVTAKVTIDGVSSIQIMRYWYQWETGQLLYIA